jgi:predicted TIM-barrel fold metal-dependent hydrolase
MGSQQQIFENCSRYYPENTKFVILPMDMAYMGAGKVPRAYVDQLSELSKLKKTHPQTLPFIHIDPRREGVFDLLKQSVEEWGFKGVKLYPPLGYFPYDERLYPIYEYCEKNNLSVISHCSPYNPVHFKGSKKELYKLLAKSYKPIETKGKNRKKLCSNFSHPNNYSRVLEDFSNLNICLAHFGSEYYWDKYLANPNEEDNWFVIIKEMLKKHNNLYSDISFTLNKEEFFPLLKVLLANQKLKNKILFGSDYYMVETKTTELKFSIDLRAYLGENIFSEIAINNPHKFLKL